MMKNVEKKKVLRGPSFSLTPAEWRRKKVDGGVKRSWKREWKEKRERKLWLACKNDGEINT